MYLEQRDCRKEGKGMGALNPRQSKADDRALGKESLNQACKSSDKKTTVQLDNDGHNSLCVWENEDYIDGKWITSHNKERRHWSTYDLKISSDYFDEVEPEVPEGLEGDGWTYSRKKGDDHGWVYASTYTGPWASTPSTMCYARCRIWQNT
ncbi:hypothetical protein PsorP6_003214 [Peronosclerospora sorghi]|uniref:Uncharacterized protein n=1 Tax=Peronosclerospora sorghi TaxID=230839 RepID=A0ACC0VMI2_9STRA|nr:hypothetical protein PsorP6_003214 [Peronosclerospora sorghi]